MRLISREWRPAGKLYLTWHNDLWTIGLDKTLDPNVWVDINHIINSSVSDVLKSIWSKVIFSPVLFLALVDIKRISIPCKLCNKILIVNPFS